MTCLLLVVLAAAQTAPAATAEHLHLRAASEISQDPSCHSGTGSVSAGAGSVVELVGCAHGSANEGVSGFRVLWRVVGAGYFVSVSLHTDADGYARASISSGYQEVGSTATVWLCADEDRDGICDAEPSPAPVTIHWGKPTVEQCAREQRAPVDCVRALLGV